MLTEKSVRKVLHRSLLFLFLLLSTEPHPRAGMAQSQRLAMLMGQPDGANRYGRRARGQSPGGAKLEGYARRVRELARTRMATARSGGGRPREA